MAIFAEKNMEHREIIKCRYCHSSDLQKDGLRATGIQRWRCKSCHKSFQRSYLYNARKPGVKEQIIELTLNSSGVRDISRVLKISKNTVLSELRKKNVKR